MLLSCSSGIKPVSGHSNIEIRKATPGLYPTRIQINGDVQQNAQETITRIRAMFNNIQLSVSPYDTAWVAMAPSFDSKHMPCFPQCLNWIIENQQASGSWSLDPSHQLLVKESLSSTLACVLALHKWNAGELIVNKGLDFLLSNSWAIEDKNQFSPVGFDIIFPGMIQYAKDIGLNLPLDSSSVDVILQKRDREVERALNIGSERTKRDLAYVSEGLSGLIDWKDVMKYQRSNGSLFNSPATTAAALTHHSDDKSFMYLQSLLDRYGNAAPTIFPLDKYIGLSLVETLVRLGLDRYFKTEIKGILDETYRCWLQGSDEIFLDITCCAMGFRLLRMNGYGVSSDSLSQFCTQEQCFNFRSTRVIDTETVLELYRASQTIINQSDPVLENIYSWTHSFLNQVVADGACHEKKLNKEVEYALKYSIHASLDRLETKKNIELYEPDKVGLLKASYRFFNADQNNDMLALSVQDFNMCQAKLREELEELELWAKEYKLDQIKYSRLRVSLAYFTIASVLFCPVLS
ncbi:Terpene synthase [Quillaja saponaria]|uniref:Terpene synthase n=1 Tax=Quillaja saponaria TaxID=32244 RepID=A0AAD7PUU1_QUISA|nr:Terpene synthase [Quillaja saponaria]